MTDHDDDRTLARKWVMGFSKGRLADELILRCGPNRLAQWANEWREQHPDEEKPE